MPGKNLMRLLQTAQDQYGYVTAAEAKELGVPPTRLSDMVRRGLLLRMDHGLYRVPLVPVTSLDAYMEAVLWPEAPGVISHLSALDLLDLCDVNPSRIDVTVPKAHRIRRPVPRLYSIHRRELAPGDIQKHEGIPVVTPERAILDAMEVALGSELIDQAIETGRGRGLLTPQQLATLADARRRRDRVPS